jgi:hypothetical protein
MRYDPVPWTLEGVRHVEVVQELLDAGLEPAGCLVNDLSPERDSRLLRAYDDNVRADLLDEMGRAFPILLSPDRVVAAEVSDMHGSPAVRMFTFLADGALVETQRRWEQVPPWPGRLVAFRRFTTVDREMSRSVAPGRTLVISDRSPAGQLEDHRDQVEMVAAARGTAARPYPDMESVAAGWSEAFAHERAVARRTDGLIAASLVGLALVLVVFAPAGVLAGPWWPVVALALIAVLWWALPGLTVLLRHRTTWRPAFRAGSPRVVR